MRILIVEDEVIVAFHLEAALLDEGHRVVGFARDARSAKVLAGALGVIPKPVAEHVLKRAVDYAVARNSGEQFGTPPEGLIVGK